MTSTWWRRHFGHGMLLTWIAVHAVLAPVVVLRVWLPASESLPWVVYLFVLGAPLYVVLVHLGDRRWKTGGVLSVLDFYQKNGPADAVPDSSGTPRSIARQVDRQRVTITTGFAALLLWQALRFYREVIASKEYLLAVPLLTVAILLSVACISNLLQLVLFELMDHPKFARTQRTSLHRKFRLFSEISWHCLLTPIILFWTVLPYPQLWFALVVNGFYGVCLYAYYFCLEPPEGFFARTHS